ncbi:hypothetical protein [Serratia marcescens]|uniref:hypothetical protein n=2 Tax=Serratia TaxID=613 RepID=UPI0032048DEA
MNNNKRLSDNQIAYLQRALSAGEGLIEIGELARGLGKQKGHVIRKFESSFDEYLLSKMENRLVIPNGGNGAAREVKTYMLDHKIAGALAMSYDLQLGVHVLTILEDALSTINVMTIETVKDNSAGVLQAAAGFRERHRANLQYRPGASENEDRSVSLRRLGRKL